MRVSRCLLLMVAIAVGAGCTYAQNAAIERRESTVLVNPDASALIIEEVSLRGPAGRFETGIRATRPDSAAEQRLFVDLVSAVDSTNPPNEPELSCLIVNRSKMPVIECPQLLGTTRLKITYVVRNAVQFLPDHDELFYASPGGEQNRIVIVLPEQAKGLFRTQTFLRRQGPGAPAYALWSSGGWVPTIIDGNRITSVAPGPLLPQVEMVTSVFLEKGVITPPNALVRLGWFLRANPVVFLPVLTLGLMMLLSRIKGGARADRSIAPQYAPPEGLSPAEAGVLIDDRLDRRDVAATFVDLAVRGYIRIDECVPDEVSQDGQRDFVFRKLRGDVDGLRPFERTLMLHTFYGGQWTKLSSLRLRFPEIVPLIRAEVLQSLRSKRLYRVDPKQAQRWRIAATVGGLGLLLLLELTGTVSLSDSRLPGLVSIALTALIVFLFARRMTAKTVRGMRMYIAVRGLEEFINTVDSDRLARMEAHLFEKLLPYAMALGVEQRWTHTFKGLSPDAPGWYGWAEENAFDPDLFGSRLEMLTVTTPLGTARMPRGRICEL